MDSGWAQVYVAIGAAVVSVVAALFALSQALAARRQADAAHGNVEPTFHVERGESDGRPPWPFQLCINNFNRQALVVDFIAIRATEGIIVYDEQASIAAIYRAATSTDGTYRFDLTKRPGNVLNGIAPNSAAPTTWKMDFGFGPSDQIGVMPNDVTLDVEISWRYAGEASNRKTKTFEKIATKPDH